MIFTKYAKIKIINFKHLLYTYIYISISNNIPNYYYYFFYFFALLVLLKLLNINNFIKIE